jgi:hypothetical protein
MTPPHRHPPARRHRNRWGVAGGVVSVADTPTLTPTGGVVSVTPVPRRGVTLMTPPADTPHTR